jgi:hypothetical protein
MAGTELPVIKNGAGGAIFYVGLIQQANTKLLKAAPTLAAGDFKISIDGGAFANLGTLPTVTPAAGTSVKIILSQAETNGDNLQIACIDASGAEWCDLFINIQTSARRFDDLAFPATSGRSMVVDAAGLVDSNVVKLGPTGSGTAQTAKDVGGALPSAAAGASGGLIINGTNAGTVTLAALTITGTLTVSDGIVVTRSTANQNAISATGNGTGHGIVGTSGSGATGDGIRGVAASTAGNGASFLGTTTGAGLLTQGGSTGPGLKIVGGATSGAGVTITTTSGDGLSITPTAGHAVVATANGASKHGVQITGGTSGTSDGMKLIAGTGGVDLRANQTGNLVGTVSTVTTVNGLAAGVITAAAIATDALDADGLAADAIAEIVTAVLTTVMTESYAADGAAPTLTQVLLAIQQFQQEKNISGTAVTVKKLDGSTTAFGLTLDSGTAPTTITRTS